MTDRGRSQPCSILFSRMDTLPHQVYVGIFVSGCLYRPRTSDDQKVMTKNGHLVGLQGLALSLSLLVNQRQD
jgi:hypothetical protein